MPEKKLRVEVEGHAIDVSHPDKVLFPDDGITKGDLVQYYRRIAGVMVPHIRDQALMLARYPDGLGGESFYQKNASEWFPDWIRRVTLGKEGGTVTHVVCDDAATLVYLAGQATITFHAWLSRVDKLDRPDRLIFDLDPSGASFAAVRATSRAVREVLEEVGLAAYVKTTGSHGLHVVSPLDRSADFDEARAFARDVADLVAARDPKHRTTEQRKAKREGRVFLDTGRNAYAQTAVAPYSVRALAGAPIATPITWDELGDSRLGPQRYNMSNIFRRLSRREDPWADIEQQARPLADALKKLERT